uniref:Uncharacterized protein n=1 Tax=Leersia perrieri TaxID=77586 RepID=A0A0D9XPS3_9ORYZ
MEGQPHENGGHEEWDPEVDAATTGTHGPATTSAKMVRRCVRYITLSCNCRCLVVVPMGEQVNLGEWLKNMVSNRDYEVVLDPKLPEMPTSKALKKALMVALRNDGVASEQTIKEVVARKEIVTEKSPS